MQPPDPEGFSLIAMIGSAATVIATPIIWLWSKLDKKVDKHAFNNELQKLLADRQHQTLNIAKLFDKLEEHARRDEETARQIMQIMSKNQAELLRELIRGQVRDRD